MGMVGYGLHVALLLLTGTTVALAFSMSWVVNGFDLPGFVTPIPSLLLSIAWLSVGQERKSGLFRASGVMGILVFAITITSAVLNGVYPSPAVASPSSPSNLQALFGAVVLAVLAGLFAITFYVLETISFFSAGKAFQNRMFRLAGWGRVFAIVGGAVVLIIAVVYGLLAYLTSNSSGGPVTLAVAQVTPVQTSQFMSIITLAVAGLYFIFAVPEIFAFLGFRRIPAAVAEPVPAQPAVAPVPADPS
jgi:hypothetical protein